MIRIAITPAAYAAIAATLPDGAALKAPQPTNRGNYFVWLPPTIVDRLDACRSRGEGYSDIILRLARG